MTPQHGFNSSYGKRRLCLKILLTSHLRPRWDFSSCTPIYPRQVKNINENSAAWLILTTKHRPMNPASWRFWRPPPASCRLNWWASSTKTTRFPTVTSSRPTRGTSSRWSGMFWVRTIVNPVPRGWKRMTSASGRLRTVISKKPGRLWWKYVSVCFFLYLSFRSVYLWFYFLMFLELQMYVCVKETNVCVCLRERVIWSRPTHSLVYLSRRTSSSIAARTCWRIPWSISVTCARAGTPRKL